jgi:4-hydroxyphenylpyruvate dioxygenase-like putative hemolysin
MNTKCLETSFLGILIFSFLVLVAGCNKHKETASHSLAEDLIPMDSMVSILVDVQLIESILKVKYPGKHENQEYTKRYYDHLLTRHGITRQQLDESLEYYQKNVESLDKIYTEVITQLSKIQAESQ